MPKERAKKQAASANGKSISMLSAMRHAMAKMGSEAKPKEYHEFIKSKFNLDMDLGVISTYKSQLRKEAAQKSAVIKTPSTDAFSLQDIQAVKKLADQIGAEKLKQLAEVLTK